MISAVIFDCFGVLYVDARQYFYETKVPHFEAVRREVMLVEKQASYGFISEDESLKLIAKLTHASSGELRAHPQGHFIRNDRLVDVLAKLHKDGRKTALLSNVSGSTMERYINSKERQRLFDASILSGEVGITKPDRRIYELAADRLQVAAEQCIFIDDSIDNCEGAVEAGMQAIHYKTSQETLNDLQNKLDTPL